MARLVDYIIDDIRSHTENEDFSDTIGIKDIEFLRFINDAQYRIHSLVVQQHPQVFLEEKTISTTADTSNYALPNRTYLGNKISSVEYSSTGLTDDFYPLRPSSLRQRNPGSKGDPVFYIRKSGTILVSPTPQHSTGTLRITYIKSIPRLDSRRASVASVTLDSGTSTITDLTLNVTTDTIDSAELDKHTRITIVDAEGNIKMENIRFDSINTTTGAVTINSSFTYDSGETITTGDYVVSGAYSTTHSILDNAVERYLISYASMKVFQRDSSADIDPQIGILREMENEIVAAYADITDDISEIPAIISPDDEWCW